MLVIPTTPPLPRHHSFLFPNRSTSPTPTTTGGDSSNSRRWGCSCSATATAPKSPLHHRLFIYGSSNNNIQMMRLRPPPPPRRVPGGCCKRRRLVFSCMVTDPDCFQVGRLIGTYGFMNITSYSGLRSEGMLGSAPLQPEDSGIFGSFKVQDVGEGNFQISASLQAISRQNISRSLSRYSRCFQGDSTRSDTSLPCFPPIVLYYKKLVAVVAAAALIIHLQDSNTALIRFHCALLSLTQKSNYSFLLVIFPLPPLFDAFTYFFSLCFPCFCMFNVILSLLTHFLDFAFWSNIDDLPLCTVFISIATHDSTYLLGISRSSVQLVKWFRPFTPELLTYSCLKVVNPFFFLSDPLYLFRHSIEQVYPGQQVGGIEADMMAANELNAHAFLQSNQNDPCQNIQLLVGGFETKTGEQWLAFRNDGIYSAADYAKVSSQSMLKDPDHGDSRFWNPFDKDLTLRRRRYFVTKLFQGTMRGLAYMHDNDRLHQSLGPYSVVLNTMVEKEAAYLVPRLRDLAFAVDVRYPQLENDSGTLSEGLWRRASAAGAFTPMEKRAFGIADDIYEAGLLLAYLAFLPFCEAGTMDSLSLQRLLENTFQLDLEATREYCLADDRLLEGVRYLDLRDTAGWELLQAMLNRDFRKRPTAEAVLNDRFLSGSSL